jgi:hypothetical protein
MPQAAQDPVGRDRPQHGASAAGGHDSLTDPTSGF